jgi:thiol-disulfide isomerase/thioredoxin
MDQDASGWKTLLTRANQLVRSATHPPAQLPVEGHLPGFDGATGWLNSPPLTTADLRSHVVLVNFWTYTCINWLRTLAYVRAWADRYTDHGLTVIGVHTPEFDFEHDLDNVRQEVQVLGVDYPVAVDNDYVIWTAFSNLYWPAFYFVDAQGQIRHHRFGEGDYEMSEMVLQQLLIEAGSGRTDQELTSVDARGVEVAADWDSLRSPENYLGYERTDNFVSPNGAILETSYAYAAPPEVGTQPLGSLGRLDRHPAGHRAQPGRWADPLPLPGSRPAPGHGPAGPGHLGSVPGAARRAAPGSCPRQRCRRSGQRHPHRPAAVPARPPARPGHRAHLRDHLPGSWPPGLRLHLRLDHKESHR